MVTRRNFMAAILAAGAAPAIVRAESIMRINPKIIVPETFLPIICGSTGDEYRVRFTADAAVNYGDLQWERRKNGGVWVPIQGVTGPRYTIPLT